MRPDHEEFVEGFKLAAIAAVSAVLMATLVIGLGRVALPRPQAMAAGHQPVVLVSLR